ncbi:MAG: phospho-sugar mutase [Anaerorhabdus sp.]
MENFKKNFDRWYTNPNLDPELKIEMENMSIEERNDAFYTNIAFGTAGMRGKLGAGTNRLNIHTIRKANLGFTRYIRANGTDAMARGVVIAYDNRHKSKEFALDCARMFANNGIKSFIFSELRPTPELSFTLRELGCFGGIVITASHNPKEYNGYKLYDEHGGQLIPSVAAKVIAEVDKIEDELEICVSDADDEQIIFLGKDIDRLYFNSIKTIQFHPDQKKDIKIVFSPQHGTSVMAVPYIFEECGYNTILVESQCSVDPDFSNTITPNPEDPKAYIEAIKLAEKNNADLILVCDPDADRMGVGIRHNGKYELLTGNQSGALLLEYILSQRKLNDNLPKNGVVFNTVVTGDLGEKICDYYQVELRKTLTGFKFIGEKIVEINKDHSKEYLFGYEESYGSLISPFARDKDAQQACLMLAEACAYYKNQNKSLYDVLFELYELHGFYEESQFAITLDGEKGALRIKEILDDLRKNPITSINNSEVVVREDYLSLKCYKDGKESDLKGFTSSNVLKYILADGSWVAIRPSGTEPKCKFYFCTRAKNAELAAANTLAMQNDIKKITKI